MNLTTKQRAFLRAQATHIDTIMQIGKGGVGEAMVKTVVDALEARELIKMKVLENSGEYPRDLGEELAAACGAELVTVIGNKIVLYRPASDPKRRKIELPRA
ncbi:MAG: ribosome assembly RNA-binding protein YhbY [Clostridia bacterium]|nr:ribosome assembly RNA-binding protein YhbY [Clostridia bacterium]